MMTIKMLGFELVRKKGEEDGETAFEVKRTQSLRTACHQSYGCSEPLDQEVSDSNS